MNIKNIEKIDSTYTSKIKQNTSSHSIESISLNKIRKRSSNEEGTNKNLHLKLDNNFTLLKLPYIKMSIDSTLTVREIFNILIRIANKKGYDYKIDINERQCYLSKRIFSIEEVFKKIITCFKEKSLFNKVSLSVETSTENQNENIVEIQSFSGKPSSILSLFDDIILGIINMRKKVNILKTVYYDIKKYSELLISNDSISLVERLNKSASIQYDIYKILSCEKYEIGKRIKNFYSQFNSSSSSWSSSYSSSSSTSLKLQIATQFSDTSIINTDSSNEQQQEPLKQILKFIFSIENMFNCYYNLGNKMTHYNSQCSFDLVIENFIFSRVYTALNRFYQSKYKTQNHVFNQRVKLIKSTMTTKKIIEFLEIKTKFIDFSGLETMRPYSIPIDIINKIEFEYNPSLKFDILMKSLLELKAIVLCISSGKYELDALDDELPLTIYMTTQIEVTNFVSEVYMIENYLKFSEKCLDKESKIVTNFCSAIEFISNIWEINEERSDIS